MVILNIKKYEDFIKHRLLEVEAWTRDGIKEKEIAKKLGISYSTLREYKKKHAALAKALSINNVVADIIIENALYKRAKGYKYDEVTKELEISIDKDGNPIIKDGAIVKNLVITKVVTKEVAGDVGAQQFWLKNRKQKEWKDKQQIEHSGETTVNTKLDLTHLTTEEIKELLKSEY